MGLRLDVPVLGGSLVRLEPLSVRHALDLARAAEEDRSAYDFTVVPRAPGARGGGAAPRLGHVLGGRGGMAGRQGRPGLPPAGTARVC